MEKIVLLGSFFTPRDIILYLILDPDDLGYRDILLNNDYGYIGAYCGCHMSEGMICVMILGNEVFDYIPDYWDMKFPFGLIPKSDSII